MPSRTRRRILEYISKRRTASAQEVARGLGMNSAAVRHHLSILVSDGRLVSVPVQRNPTRGRPRKRYQLSDVSLGSNLELLCDFLLSGWPPGEGIPPAGVPLEMLLRDAFTGALGSKVQASSATARMAALVSRLNGLHYVANWEAGAAGPRIILGHCPYAGLARKHPILCRMDERAIGNFLEGAARQIAKIDTAGGTASQCVLALEAKPSRQT